jgi:amidohydrolase
MSVHAHPTNRAAGFLDRALDALPEALHDATQLRHEIHADPHVGGDEQATTRLMAARLGVTPDQLEEVEEGAIVRIGAVEGPVIALRAELDALAIVEESDVAWRSLNGAAHLCGHDVHLAALFAVVRTLSAVGVPMPLLAVLQPREETLPCGAADMIESTALRRHDVAAFLGVHLQPQIPEGTFSAAAGAVNASADEFTITVRGTAGHGAYPHLTRDPIVAAAALITAVQHLVSRRSDPMHPAVVTIGRVQAGSSVNAIPAEATLGGTIRAFDEEHRAELHRLLASTASGIAQAHGCQADVSLGLGEPVLVNDATVASRVAAGLRDRGWVEAPPVRSCGADDFAFYCTRYPSLMVFAGVGTADPGSPGLHHPAFVPPDDTVAAVARIMLTAYAHVVDLVMERR